MPYITLNKSNFFYNLDTILKKTLQKDKIAIVLKDNAYGHGLKEISSMAYEYGITKCVVQNLKEAQLVKDKFSYILVLADIPKESDLKIHFTINSIKSIKKFPKNTKVELKVDSGMHRNGIMPSQLEDAFKEIKKYNLELKAVFTHHRSADELSSEWFWQNENFKKIKKTSIQLAKKYSFKPLKFHSANSASLFRYETFKEDMARVGIASYGCLEMPNSLNSYEFKPVLSLFANKISSRVLKKSQAVGYGATFYAKEDILISNYNIGYGDGFLRVLSNNFTTPNGSKLVGRISMDNSSFISDSEELLIFNDARDVAKKADTISYEVLTSLKEYIPRYII